MTWMLTGTLATALSGLLICIYYWQKGQFADSEETKYQLFRDEE